MVPLALAGALALTAATVIPQPAAAAGDREIGDKTKPATFDRTRLPVSASSGTNRAAGISEPASPPAAAIASDSKPATAPSAAPAVYTVLPGDTVSDIAGRFGLSTPHILAANGLSWSSLIHPGQQLLLDGTNTATPQTSDTPEPEVRKHTISAGETISAIAARYGLETAAVLSANGLGWSSLIFPGQTIVIPESTESSVSDEPMPEPVPVAVTQAEPQTVHSEVTAALDADQQANAATIIGVGRSLGVSDRAIVIALATAAQESMLRNLDYGDRDSVGLFQQRPSTGWGTVADLTDPQHAARLFFGGPTGPNIGTRGLLDITDWESLTLTQAAQAVQISAFPEAYAKWESSATTWLADLG